MYKAERKKMQKRDNRSQALHTTHNSMVFFFFFEKWSYYLFNGLNLKINLF